MTSHHDVHGKPDGAVREVLRNLLDYAEQRECSHEATHRGGSIWTICDECGKKWADDRGGFIPYQEPKEITQARTALEAALSGYVVVPQSALDWLFGEGPDADGKWFGETIGDGIPKLAGRYPRTYWWRSKFRAMIQAAPPEMEG